MNPKKLDKNSIGLTGAEVVAMAKELLPILTIGDIPKVNSTAIFNIHITYQENIKLKELADLLNTVDLSVNDYYRDSGICNNKLNQFSTVVSKVQNGSIWLEIIISVFSGVTSAVLAEYMLQRMRKNKEKCDDNEGYIRIEAGDNNTINIHIDNTQKVKI